MYWEFALGGLFLSSYARLDSKKKQSSQPVGSLFLALKVLSHSLDGWLLVKSAGY